MQGFRKSLDIFLEFVDGFRLDLDHVRRRLFGCKIGLQLLALRLQRLQDQRDIFVVDRAPRNLIENAGDSLLNVGERRFLRLPASAALGRDPLRLAAVFLDVGVDIARVSKHHPKPVDHVALYFLDIVPGVVRATARFFMRAANDTRAASVSAVDRQAAAALRTFQQTRQQALVLRCRPGVLAADGFLPSPSGFKDLIRDNSQVRCVHGLDEALVVHARHAPTRHWVLDHLDAVPNYLPNIKRVAQDAVSSLVVPVDRGRIPACSARRWRRFVVQRACDDPWPNTGDVHVEDPAHDGSFFLNNLQFAFLAYHWSIAEGLPAGVPARADHAYHAAANLLRAFLALHLADDAVHADRNRVHDAAVDAVHFDAAEAERLVNVRQVGDITRDAVWRLGDQDVEFPALR